jgi:hypothetical protein
VHQCTNNCTSCNCFNYFIVCCAHNAMAHAACWWVIVRVHTYYYEVLLTEKRKKNQNINGQHKQKSNNYIFKNQAEPGASMSSVFFVSRVTSIGIRYELILVLTTSATVYTNIIIKLAKHRPFLFFVFFHIYNIILEYYG